MKYAIYNRSANSYLTKMVFEGGYSNDTQFTCGLTEYITDAHLLDIKETADDIITDIESVKFMEKGCFVVHSFDETLDDQYIISEAGNPTKVVDNITVDLDGTINVKYGTMMSHWSTASLIYVINKLNRLQDASAPARYCSWNATFDIYKVITVIDENGHNHYQFINVTDKGIVSAKKEANSLAKRIEELEKSNYDLGEQVVARGAAANRLQEENDKLEAKVESIKREARQWKTMYESEAETLDILKDAIDTIYTDLQSVTASDDLKETSKALSHNSDLDHIFMPTKTSYVLDKGDRLTAKDEIYYIVNHMITMYESASADNTFPCITADASGLLKDVNDIANAKRLANNIIDICEATTDPFEVTLKKFSQLYEAVNDPIDDEGAIMYALKSVLMIFSSLEDKARNIIDEKYDISKEKYRLRAARNAIAEVIFAIRNAIYNNNGDAFLCIENRMKIDPDFNSDPFMAGVRENIKDICAAEKRNLANNDLKNGEIAKAASALEEVNDKNDALADMLKEITNCIADIMAVTHTMDDDVMISNLRDVSCKMGVKTIDDGPIYGLSVILSTLITNAKAKTEWARRAEEAICDCTKCNEALGEWKRKCKAKDANYEMLQNKLKACKIILESTQSSLTATIKERDKALEQKEFYKRQANSVYGMTIPGRCNGKQMFCDITTGKKILVDKEKYDDLVECVNNINTTYEILKCADFTMNKPIWLDGVITRIKKLTE